MLLLSFALNPASPSRPIARGIRGVPLLSVVFSFFLLTSRIRLVPCFSSPFFTNFATLRVESHHKRKFPYAGCRLPSLPVDLLFNGSSGPLCTVSAFSSSVQYGLCPFFVRFLSFSKRCRAQVFPLLSHEALIFRFIGSVAFRPSAAPSPHYLSRNPEYLQVSCPYFAVILFFCRPHHPRFCIIETGSRLLSARCRIFFSPFASFFFV